MARFDAKNSTGLKAAIWLTIALVAIADFLTPLGVAVWVFYLMPIILCLFGWRPAAPLLVAGTATILTSLGFLFDSPGISPVVAGANRVFGIATIWTLGIFGRQFLMNKLSVREQTWLRQGQTGIASVMQGEMNLRTLGERIVRHACEYLEAQVGAIYVRTDDGTFHRFAGYALESHTSPESEWLKPGEGLAGQAIKDGRTFVVQSVPPGYLPVNSTLGKASPRELIVAPASADGLVEAILELGFLQPTSPSDVKLFELVSEPIGMAVRASKYRARLEELLEETQRQAEELQAQSEELRVANEELEDQSRILKDSQTRLENQQAELEETNAQLEEQTQALESQKVELQRASRYKSEFLANMSHELRTPLNSSLILAKLLGDNKQGNLTPEQVKFAQTIYSAGNDLLDLINDILDLSKIEAGKITVQPESVAIARVCDNLSRTFRPLAEQQGLVFSVDIDPSAPPVLLTDVLRLEQILKNLLSNAVKFTEKGSVKLRVFNGPRDWVLFAVTDTGIGISASEQSVIFDAFRQADGSTHRKYGGTGLGLSISRDLARLLGGEILVTSALGQGSTFTLNLPARMPAEHIGMRPAADPPPPSYVPAKPPGPVTHPVITAASFEDDRNNLGDDTRILLVIEDDDRFARILFDLAHDEGFKCVVAPTASAGLALARQCSPSAVILDINLPDQSGLYVLDQLKREPATRHVPVHVVSGFNYRHMALELGAVGYDLKPVAREHLVTALRRMEAKFDQAMRRILIVEDDNTQRESLKRLLEQPGVEITAVGTAAETLQKLRESIFDCIVLDLGLGDMSGYDLLDKLANEEAYSFPPLIIYTGRSLQPAEEQRLRRYSSSIIIKGARSPERLLDEVTLFLHQVESALPPDQQKMLRFVRDRDAALEGRRILVVEDDVRNVFAITSILEPKGAKIEIARTGKEALAALERSVQREQPVDLVLMDIMMPEMDGLTAMREIRARREFSRLPILALTAKAMPDDREQCIAAGANDYISKPLDVDKLLSLTRVWIPKP